MGDKYRGQMVQAVSVPTISIRIAEPGDLEMLGDVYRRSSLSNLGDRANLLANPDTLVFDAAAVHERRTRVAFGDGRIVGFATIRHAGDDVVLEDLFVEPEWMRQGVGRCLVDDALAIARKTRAERVDVTANDHALAFYQALGFVIDGLTETPFGPAHQMHLDVPADGSADGSHGAATTDPTSGRG